MIVVLCLIQIFSLFVSIIEAVTTPYVWIDFDHVHRNKIYYNDPDNTRIQLARIGSAAITNAYPTQLTTANDGISQIGIFSCKNDPDRYSATFLEPMTFNEFSIEVIVRINSKNLIFDGYIIGIEETYDNIDSNAISFNEISGKISGQSNKFFAANPEQNGWHSTNEYWDSTSIIEDIDTNKFYHVLVSQDSTGIVRVYVNGKTYGTSYKATGGAKANSMVLFSSIYLCGNPYGDRGIDADIAAFGFYTESFDSETEVTASCLVAGLSDCDGIPTIPTASPTSSPTQSPVVVCQKGVNYWIDGTPAIVHGDPHFKTFNGENHDMMGRSGQQYYYMHPCIGSTRNDMPFNILGYHYIANGQITGLDYITFELFDYNNNKYHIYLSASLHSYASDIISPSSYYDRNTNKGTNLISGKTVSIGERFRFYYKQSGIRVDFRLTILHTGCILSGYIQGQRINNGRYRMHYLYINPPSCYKCHTCGLLGSFMRAPLPGTAGFMKTCNGGAYIFQDGWGVNNLDAYDINGWSWWKQYVDINCKYWDGTARRRLQVGIDQFNEIYKPQIEDDFVFIDPCDATIKNDVIDACRLARAENTVCCDTIIGDHGKFCDRLEKTCAYDGCVGADGDINKIDEQVETLFHEPMDLVCSIPNVGDDFNPNNEIAEDGAPETGICGVDYPDSPGANVVFLLDKSGSIDATEWDLMISFVKSVIQFDLSDLSYVSLIEYSNVENFDQFLDFVPVENNKGTIVTSLINNKKDSSGWTYTYNAVSRTLDIMEEYKDTCNDGCNIRRDILFLLTDGVPTDQVCPMIQGRIRDSVVDIIIIGIGLSDVGLSKISCLDLNDNGNDLLSIDGFTVGDFTQIQPTIKAKTCT